MDISQILFWVWLGFVVTCAFAPAIHGYVTAHRAAKAARRVKIVCSWCKDHQRGDPSATLTSHTICGACAALMSDELKSFVMSRSKKTERPIPVFPWPGPAAPTPTSPANTYLSVTPPAFTSPNIHILNHEN